MSQGGGGRGAEIVSTAQGRTKTGTFQQLKSSFSQLARCHDLLFLFLFPYCASNGALNVSQSDGVMLPGVPTSVRTTMRRVHSPSRLCRCILGSLVGTRHHAFTITLPHTHVPVTLLGQAPTVQPSKNIYPRRVLPSVHLGQYDTLLDTYFALYYNTLPDNTVLSRI